MFVNSSSSLKLLLARNLCVVLTSRLMPHTQSIRRTCWVHCQRSPIIWPCVNCLHGHCLSPSHRHLSPGFSSHFLSLFAVILALLACSHRSRSKVLKCKKGNVTLLLKVSRCLPLSLRVKARTLTQAAGTMAALWPSLLLPPRVGSTS